MRKLIIEEWISLDRYVADKNDQLDFFTQLSPEENTYSDKDQLAFLESIDTILLGRKTYELFVNFWPAADAAKEIIADRLNSIPKIIFSNTLTKAPWGNWPEAQVLSGDAVEEVKQLKAKPGKDMVLWGSISLSQALMKAGLVDEYHLQVCPVLTGGGRKFFLEDRTSGPLKLTGSKQYPTGAVLLKYQVS